MVVGKRGRLIKSILALQPESPLAARLKQVHRLLPDKTATAKFSYGEAGGPKVRSWQVAVVASNPEVEKLRLRLVKFNLSTG